MPAIDRAGPVVLDAAMGTRLVARGLDLASSDPCLWVLDRPDDVREIHRRDVAAGADGVTTDTFGAHRAWLDRFGRAEDVARVNRRAVEIAREAAGPFRLVLGSVGPAASAHPRDLAEQVDLLSDAGVDALLFETLRPDEAVTILSVLGECGVRGSLDRRPDHLSPPCEAGAGGVKLVENAGPAPTPPCIPPSQGGKSSRTTPAGYHLGEDLPRIVSLFAWPSDGLADLARRLEDLGASAIGVNCVAGMPAALDVLRRLAPVTTLPLLVRPSAGLPGEPPALPGSFAAAVPELISLGVRFLGGCCGTTHEHVAALRHACDASAVRAAETLA
ncbi:MAG: homocysteine S-methyltransferase family protein [Isosphaeraceae bacterium]